MAIEEFELGLARLPAMVWTPTKYKPSQMAGFISLIQNHNFKISKAAVKAQIEPKSAYKYHNEWRANGGTVLPCYKLAYEVKLKERNSEDTIKKRRRFVEYLMENTVDFKRKCVFVDENGFKKKNMVRPAGWSKKGTPVEVEVQPEGTNLSILGCMSAYGLIAVSQQVPKSKGYKKQKIAGTKRALPHDTKPSHFLLFVEEMTSTLNKLGLHNMHIIMDNATIHKTEEVGEVRKTPLLKNEMIADRTEEAVQKVTPEDCQGWIRHSRRLFTKHKKGAASDPANFRPISLTSTFRKILEKCIASDLELESPPLDIAQGGFRRSRSTLDQALCLVETCSILRQHHLDRDHIWQTLQPSVSPPLLALLRNLFDEVNIEVLLSNATSYRFLPATGVLQGSILSPSLYSIYINQLPAFLCTQPIEEVPSTDTRRFAQSINCLLYADDVVLIAAPQDLAILLQQCEDHSHRLGYRWNPLKCAILAPSSDTQAYSLYGTTIPRQGIFSYLGIPINPGGYLNTAQLIQDNVNKALQTMNQMTTIGVNNKGFDRLLSVVFEDASSFPLPFFIFFPF
ncbi:hypothetical protein G6F64_010268 [Rhizopus arrhizus]|uniref:Reverse transcriptase domain-containing protein n=1 Tax=Rhizopus oryzae TaxID=64495 RepID=A0A9P6X1D7_RHIOR|nr:hypothetical protein G6F64_010268 [Rhizopus arrhizus]